MFGGCFLAYEGAHKVIHALRHDDHDHDVPRRPAGTGRRVEDHLRERSAPTSSCRPRSW